MSPETLALQVTGWPTKPLGGQMSSTSGRVEDMVTTPPMFEPPKDSLTLQLPLNVIESCCPAARWSVIVLVTNCPLMFATHPPPLPKPSVKSPPKPNGSPTVNVTE